jgi:hypothetical protein
VVEAVPVVAAGVFSLLGGGVGVLAGADEFGASVLAVSSGILGVLVGLPIHDRRGAA